MYYFVLLVLLSTQDIAMFETANTIQKHFVDHPFINQYGFEMTYRELVTVDDWWMFMEKTFIKGMSQFGDQNEDANLTMLENTVLLGGLRLRQIRVENSTCSIPNAFLNQFKTCYGEYTKSNEDRNTYFK